MLTRQLEIIILAAGLGHRFEKSGGVGHKALAPVWDSRGTLPLLLDRLVSSGANKHALVTIVTGRFHADIEAIVACQDVQLLHNPDHASESLLQSLARACANSKAASLLVLFADTLYSMQAIEILIESSLLHTEEVEPLAMVAVSPANPVDWKKSKNETYVDISPDGEVLYFDDPNSDWQMAHAVIWPKQFVPHLLDASRVGRMDRQWHLLKHIAQITSKPSAKVLCLPVGATCDIDTVDELTELQHQRRIQPCHLEYFIKHVSKERTINAERDSLSGVIYQKHCESIASAEHEFLMMKWLHRNRPDWLVRPIKLSGRNLQLELAAGIRLYDLLRQIIGHPKQEVIRKILLDRCIERLRGMQHLMMQKTEITTFVPYPFETKVVELLKTMAELLGIFLNEEVKVELAEMQLVWDASCVVPFRDATPKNMVVGIESVAPYVNAEQRVSRLSAILDHDEAFWREVPIIDVDFTSTIELTTPEDDVISLMAHGMTYRPDHEALARQPLLAMFDPSLERTDLTWFVRYLRFGGRKLLYKLLNPKGFAVRFRYDEPSFYFEQLPQRLSPEFRASYPSTFALLIQLRDSAERYRGYLPDQRVHDPFLGWIGKQETALKHYWQESPLEWMAQDA